MAATETNGDAMPAGRGAAEIDTMAGGHGRDLPAHHLSDELLLDYAAGVTDEAVEVLIAAHLTLCPTCRARADHLESVGGAMMDDLTPAPLSDDALERMMARLDDEANDAGDATEAARPDARRPTAGGETDPAGAAMLPRVLQRYVGESAETIAWTPLGLGVDRFELPVSGKTRATLLRVPAGRAVPQHTHEGNEYVMVLQGAFADAYGRFGRGDVEIADSSIDHRPVAEAGADCICLAVTDGPLRLTSLVGRALNRFVRF